MSNRKWYLGLLILFVIFAGLLLQFFFSSLRIRELVHSLEPDPGEEAGRHIVLISQELDNPFWRSVEQGALEASRKYKFDLQYDGPLRINASEQIKLLAKAIAAKADAVLVQGINDPQYRELINKAVSMGIPVITVDTDEPGSRRLSYVGTDNLEAGKQMGKLVAKAAAGSPGGIGVLVGSKQAANQQLRLEGFRSVISHYPKLNVVSVRASNISLLQASGEAEDMLNKEKQIRYLIGFSTLDGVGLMEAAARMHRQDVRIFAFDDLPETIEGIRHDKIKSTIVQQPREMGYKAVSLLSYYFQGKPLQPENYTSTKVLDAAAVGTGTGEERP
ncbi:substrate-binding domain-containing protein [Paenibacillus sp. sptzw28]|uniref:substrate-binding domain-containing protein n=1 Tax=Paenibacillus sp. sptzw28 TaxID=715179 RepID=UPI001C6EBB28|nr:substrate-binding domain-containing protein [Paenibacillus sp. sptzw28]QYR22865.1 substrate-binding domain-containing protein [Paenibacillus sp. sptzw28]